MTKVPPSRTSRKCFPCLVDWRPIVLLYTRVTGYSAVVPCEFSFATQVVKRTGLRTSTSAPAQDAAAAPLRLGLRTSTSAPAQDAAAAPLRLKFNISKPLQANASVGSRGKVVLQSPPASKTRQSCLAALAHNGSGRGVESPYWASDNRKNGEDDGDADKPVGRSLRSRANMTQ
jgi:hypothetical protein